jgi:hypothetical protein
LESLLRCRRPVAGRRDIYLMLKTAAASATLIDIVPEHSLFAADPFL